MFQGKVPSAHPAADANVEGAGRTDCPNGLAQETPIAQEFWKWSWTGQKAKNFHIPGSRAAEEHRNTWRVGWAAEVEVPQVGLDWQHKGEFFMAR